MKKVNGEGRKAKGWEGLYAPTFSASKVQSRGIKPLPHFIASEVVA